MMRSLFSGVSGLRNHQTRMDVIGNNIANVNTIGFKGSRVNFQDVLSQTMQGASGAQGNRGGTNPMQVGLGMGLASIDTIFTDGSFQPTGKQTDLALKGSGFFVLSDGNNKYYTRAGNFDFDTDGNFLVPGTGLKVMGWQGDINTGKIDDNAPIGPIKIPMGATIPAEPTANIVFGQNLSDKVVSGNRIFSSTKIYDSKGNAYSVDTVFAKPVTTTAVKLNSATLDNVSTDTRTQRIYVGDTKGVLRALTVEITNAGGDKWNVRITENGNEVGKFDNQTAADLSNGLTIDKTLAGTSQIQFTLSYPSASVGTYKEGTTEYVDTAKTEDNTWYWATGCSDPAVTLTNPVYDPTATGNVANRLEFTKSGMFAKGGGNISATFANGANSATVKVDFAAVTQTASETSVKGVGDGYTDGVLSDVAVDTDGTIFGRFSNGINRSLARVAVMDCNNPGGLTKIGESLYAESNNSGVFKYVKNAKMNPGTLEMSNVDMAQEFSNMIITQRGFQANSKIISVTDEMLQELANLKR